MLTVVITLAGQLPVLQSQAHCFDDNEYIVENPLVQRPGLDSAGRFLREVLEPSTVDGYYQPLSMISLMLDWAAGGRPDQLAPFHRTSLILHALNAGLVTLLLYELVGHLWAASIVGILFGLHPTMVETIVWVGERKTVLAAFLALLAMLSYVRYARSRGWAWYVLCTVLFVLALLAKPTPTLLPVGLLLLDVWPLNRFSRRAVLEKIPLLILAAVSAWITYESQKRTAIADLPARETWWHVPLVLSHNIVFYLQRFVWPAHPSAHYPMPDVVLPSDPQFAIGLAGTAILIVLLAVSLRRTWAAAVGWLFFFVVIFPATGVIGFANVIAADRFAYLPSVGLMLPLAALIAWAWGQSRSARMVRFSIMALTACAAFALGISSRAYLREWSNTEQLFCYMLRLYPDAPSLHLSLGKELEDQDRDQEAMAEYRRTLELSPWFWIPHMNLGQLLVNNKQLDEGIREYEAAIACKSDFYDAHINLGNALMQKQMLDKALVHYRRAVEIRQNSADAGYNLANALLATGDTNGAVEQYERALACDPDHAPTRKNFGTVLLQLGRRSEAVGQYKEALRLRPDWWDVANQLAWIFADQKDPSLFNVPEAVRYAEIACRVSEQREPLPLATLAALLARSGKTAQAQPLAQRAIELARVQGGEAGARLLEEQLRQELDVRESAGP